MFQGMRRCAIFLLTGLAFAAAGGNAFAESFTQEKCSLCHILDSRFIESDSAAVAPLRAEGERRVCFSCHNGTVVDDRETLWQGAQHPPPQGRKGPCSACHSPHGQGGWSVLAGTSVPLRRGGNALCLGCHRSHGPDGGSIHRSGFPDGGCQECHKAHGGMGEALLRGPEEQMCLRCHIAMDSALRGGHSWKTVSASVKGPESAPPACTSCHPVHARGKEADSPSALCGRCHPGQLSRSADGAARHPSVEKCLNCHTVHTRSEETGKAFRGIDMKPVPLCGRCHSGEIAETNAKARDRGTHPSFREEKDICLRCHRIHAPAPRTRLLATDRPYFCLDCHKDQNTILQSGEIALAHPVFEYVDRRKWAEAAREKKIFVGPRGELVCQTCHLLHRSDPGTALLPKGNWAAERCLLCHEGKSGMEHRPLPGGKVNASCGDCHPVHGQVNRKTRDAEDAGREGAKDPWGVVCSKCHKEASRHLPGREDRSVPRGKGLPAFDAQGRRADVTGAISCPTCHESHGPSTGNKRLRRSYAQSGFLCTACHREKETIALTRHDLRGISGKSICEPCHLPHGGKAPLMWGLSADGGEGQWETCRSCHRDKGFGSPVPREGHPVNVVAARPVPEKFPLFGQGGRKARTGVLTCSTCHEVHGTGFLPLGEVTGLLLRAEAGQEAEDIGRTRTCVPCHQEMQGMHGQADCIWCHAPHSERKVSPDCRGCHALGDKGIARDHAGRGLECGACHRIHASGQERSAAATCLGCHPKSGKIGESAHGELEGGPCRTCHPAHEDVEFRVARRHSWEEVFVPDLACLRCHREDGEGPSVPRGEHPKSRKKVPTNYGAVVTLETPVVIRGRLQEGGRPLFPLFDESGKKSLAGQMGCVTCHDPHAGNTTATDNDGRVSTTYLRDSSGVFLAELCAPCHRNSAGEYARKYHEIPRKTD